MARPNPDTPLAFLPPEYANQVEVARYIGAVTFGAYIWDIAANLSIYYSSRVFTLGYIIACFVFEVGRVSNCQALMIALGACNTLSQSSTAMLFLLRARAVWQDNKYVKTFLTILWLGVLGGTTTVPIGLSGVHVGPTLQCIAKSVPEYEEASPISVLIFDTFIFFTIAYRILVNIWDQEEKGVHFQAFFGLRTSLPDLSRALLVGGQKYYLLALVWSIAVIVLGALPGISPVYKSMCTIPQFATNSAMACLVFRQIKFGLTEADGTPTLHLGPVSTFQVNPCFQAQPGLKLDQPHNTLTTEEEVNTLQSGISKEGTSLGAGIANKVHLFGKNEYGFKEGGINEAV